MSNTNPKSESTVHIGACVLGWILPGMGHISIGHKRRGVLIMSGVMFLVFCGVLVGGIDAVDHKNDGLWFIAQVWCGPIVVGVDLLNQALVASLPTSQRATLVGLSHANEIGTLFIAMAGLMNFVVLLDVLHATNDEDLERREEKTKEAGAPC
jgi:MFS family permease